MQFVADSALVKAGADSIDIDDEELRVQESIYVSAYLAVFHLSSGRGITVVVVGSVSGGGGGSSAPE